MGGFGSGGGRGAPRERSLLRLDASRLKALGFFKPFWRQSLVWTRGGKQEADISIENHADHLELVYSWRPRPDEPWRPMRERVGLSFTTPQFGGRRIWLICPGCAGRKRTLWGGGRFLCAACVGMRHESQYQCKAERMLAKLQEGRVKLGGESSLDWPFPDRPKRMRKATYERLKAKDAALESAMNAELMRRFGWTLS